jgi:hypothetical protein
MTLQAKEQRIGPVGPQLSENVLKTAATQVIGTRTKLV